MLLPRRQAAPNGADLSMEANQVIRKHNRLDPKERKRPGTSRTAAEVRITGDDHITVGGAPFGYLYICCFGLTGMSNASGGQKETWVRCSLSASMISTTR